VFWLALLLWALSSLVAGCAGRVVLVRWVGTVNVLIAVPVPIAIVIVLAGVNREAA